MLYYERKAKEQGFSFIIGIDEVGRGPLAGPVVAAAVKLSSLKFDNYINDSKKLTPLQRERAFSEIYSKAFIGLGIINENIIDSLNILNATKLAMEQAVTNLFYCSRKKINNKTTIALIDGNVNLNLNFRFKNIIAGDSKSLSIASASIVAKVTRDRIMRIYDRVFPEYSFYKHKGYGTKDHFRAIRKYGPCSIHRKTFYPLLDTEKR